MYVLWNLAQRKNQGFEFQAVTFEKKEIILKGLQFYLRTWNLHFTVIISDRNLQSGSGIGKFKTGNSGSLR